MLWATWILGTGKSSHTHTQYLQLKHSIWNSVVQADLCKSAENNLSSLLTVLVPCRATDLEGGSSFGYKLLVVILLSNFAAMFLQSLSLKLGVVAERDLAQACRDAYPKACPFTKGWIMCKWVVSPLTPGYRGCI